MHYTTQDFADITRCVRDPNAAEKLAALLNGDLDPEDAAPGIRFKRMRDPFAVGVLRAADVLLDGFGIEAIFDGDGECVAEYVNTGDTYTGTILWDRDSGEVSLTSYGDWVEAFERERGEPLP